MIDSDFAVEYHKGTLSLTETHLEMEDSSIAITETLLLWHDSVEQLLIESQRSNGCQQPAVTYSHHENKGREKANCLHFSLTNNWSKAFIFHI